MQRKLIASLLLAPLTAAAACTNVIIDYAQWAHFSNTALVVHVFNNGPEQFPGAGFILFNGNGDTLAMEAPDPFTMAQESWHTLELVPGVTMPTGTFSATLELWTGSYTTHECTFDRTVDLCPVSTCTALYPQMSNVGENGITADIDWTMTNGDGALVGSGTFVFNNFSQFAVDTLCLPPGAYTLSVNHAPPVDGFLNFWIATDEITLPTATHDFTQDGVPDLLPFDFFPHCVDNATGLTARPQSTGLRIGQEGGLLHITATDDGPIGAIELLDLDGRRILTARAASTALDIDVAGVASGVYLLHAQDRRVSRRVAIP